VSSTTLPRSRASAEVRPTPRAAGARYRYDRRSGRWWWSPELVALLGLAPDAAPDTGQLLEPLDPADRTRLLRAVTGACSSGAAFALEVRQLRADGAVRILVVFGEPESDRDGGVAAVCGLLADVTDDRPDGTDRVVALTTEVEQMRSAMASRAAIEQAKGMLMLLMTCTEQVAFDLLTHISSHTHRKVRDIALVITESATGHGGLPADIREILRDACPPAR
jgi:hypothetical protein